MDCHQVGVSLQHTAAEDLIKKTNGVAIQWTKQRKPADAPIISALFDKFKIIIYKIFTNLKF